MGGGGGAAAELCASDAGIHIQVSIHFYCESAFMGTTLPHYFHR